MDCNSSVKSPIESATSPAIMPSDFKRLRSNFVVLGTDKYGSHALAGETLSNYIS